MKEYLPMTDFTISTSENGANTIVRISSSVLQLWLHVPCIAPQCLLRVKPIQLTNKGSCYGNYATNLFSANTQYDWHVARQQHMDWTVNEDKFYLMLMWLPTQSFGLWSRRCFTEKCKDIEDGLRQVYLYWYPQTARGKAHTYKNWKEDTHTQLVCPILYYICSYYKYFIPIIKYLLCLYLTQYRSIFN